MAARRGYRPGVPVVFTHVPKCAGSSLRAALLAALAPRAPASGFDACLFGTFGDFDALGPGPRQAVHLPGDDWPREADFVFVHMAASTTRRLWPRAQPMIVLREPVTRLLSLYFYWRGVADAEIAHWGAWGARVRLARLPLEDFLADPRIACQTDNIVARMLLWPYQGVPPGGFIADRDVPALVRAARRTLAGYAYVDAVEAPAFQERLGGWLGRTLAAERMNVSAAWPAVDVAAALTPEVAARLLRLTRVDRVLWAEVAGPECAALALCAQMRAVARYALG